MNMSAHVHRILLVEDSPQDAELTREALSENNVTNGLDHVSDGAAALDYLFRRGAYANRENGNPTLILLDLKMPKVDGTEVLRQIRSDPKLRTIPVIVMTSSREGPDISRCYELGVNAFVVKPVAFGEFAEAVKAIGVFWVMLNEPPTPLPAAQP